MICNATSVKKYLNESAKLFFLYGSEIVLINDSADQINEFFIKKGFAERIILTKENFKDAQKIIMQNAGGSLFDSKVIIEIIHNSSGATLPKDILSVFDTQNLNNIVIIVRSTIKKINKNSAWLKLIDSKALIIECNKLKTYEEKA